VPTASDAVELFDAGAPALPPATLSAGKPREPSIPSDPRDESWDKLANPLMFTSIAAVTRPIFG
jgi:hypothetical protein